MFDPSAASGTNQSVPWGTIVPYVLAGVGSTALVLVGAFKTIWSWAKEKDKKLVEANELRAVTAEERAERAEAAEEEAKNKYAKLKGEFKATVSALRLARRQEESIDVGHPVSIPAPSAEEEPTGRFFVDADADREWFESREREREYLRMNQAAPSELDDRLDRYNRDVDSPPPPKRLLPPRPGPKR